MLSLLIALGTSAALAATPMTEWQVQRPLSTWMAPDTRAFARPSFQRSESGSPGPKPMAWAITGAAITGFALPVVANTLYLTDRVGTSWQAGQDAIQAPVLLLWANSILWGAGGLVLAPATAWLGYVAAGGNVGRATGGMLLGVLTGAIALPFGLAFAVITVAPLEDAPAHPALIYAIFNTTVFATTTTGAMIGFNFPGRVRPSMALSPTLLPTGSGSAPGRGAAPGLAFAARW